MNMLKLAATVCGFIRKNSENRAGLFRTERFDVDTLEWSSEFCDCDDFGDFAPFMAWLDKLGKGKENLEWVNQQFSRLGSMLKQDSGLYAPSSKGKSRKSRFFPSYVINNMDLALGCEIMHELTGEGGYLDGFLGICDAVIRHGINKHGFIRNGVIPRLNVYYPMRYGLRYKPVVSGVFAELLCDASKITGKGIYAENALKILGAFTRLHPFRKYGLFPDNVYPLINSYQHASYLTKSNTAMISGLLRAVEVTGDEGIWRDAHKAMKGVAVSLGGKGGCFCRSFNLKTGLVSSGIMDKGDNQAFMDNLINGSIVLKDDEYLDIAQRCADYWVNNQQRNGLFPERRVGQDGWHKCTIDSFADMTVIMAKLHELTGQKRYRHAVDLSCKGFKHFLAKNGGMYNAVDIRNRKVADRTNELKFLGGALKGMLTAHAVLHGERIFKDRAKMLLTRDR